MLKKNTETFIGCDSDYINANVVVFGAPYDSTASYKPGSRFASKAMRSESYGLETYSPYLDLDLDDINVFDGGDLELGFANTEKALISIENFTNNVINDNKLPIMIGGEHLVTLGAVRALLKQYPDLHIIHFDAHADLREEYLGEKLSHACVMRRCYDLLGKNKIYQFGIRSGDKEEFVFSKGNTFLSKFNFNNLENTVKSLKSKPVYFTLDLDILDPSIFSGTGTPEAGGVTFDELLRAVYLVCDLNVVGGDICELSPIYDQSGVSTAVACKVLRELLLAVSK